MLSTDQRPLHAIATDILRDPALRGRARRISTPHLRVLMQAVTPSDVVGYHLARMSIMYALDCLRTYPNKQLKAELLDACNSHCKVI